MTNILSSLLLIYRKKWLQKQGNAKIIKVPQLKKLLRTNSYHKANLNFLFLSFCVYLFKKCPSQFLSIWELADPVFCSEQLRCLPYKNQNKCLTLSSDRKVQICCIVITYTKSFFHWATFMFSAQAHNLRL